MDSLEAKVKEDSLAIDIPKVLGRLAIGIRSATRVIQPVCRDAVEKAVSAHLCSCQEAVVQLDIQLLHDLLQASMFHPCSIDEAELAQL